MPLCGVACNRLTLKKALIVNIKGSSGETKEVLYVCENVKGMYLSQTALKNMNIVHKDFPATPKSILNITTTTNPLDSASNGTSPEVNLAPCGLYFANLHQPYQIKLHFLQPANTGNTFKTCPHQKLQVMKGEPLQISFAEEHTS